MDLRSRKPLRRKKTLEIVLHDIPEAPKAGFGGTKIPETVLHYMPEAPKGASGGTKIFETVLYDTPVPRKAAPEGQKYPKLFCITCPKPRKAPPEGQKYSKLFCMTHLCPERRLRRDKTRDNAGRVLCGNFGSFSGGNKKIQTGVCILMAVKSRTFFR